ncbi:MAG: DNA-directed RNA polymerase subunit L [Candidatus Heimdallarchaeota archaeon LC_2]|nr:MAG: DNA-directed RNA polymerase subunit L [Candidatus Heimdallarchaeota archaeon LC_2]
MKPMQIKVQAMEKNYIRFQVTEDPHTLFNLLRILTLEEDGVILAGYARDRTFEESLIFQIRTEGDIKPQDVLIKASRKLIENTEQFKKAFEDEYL